MIVHNPLASIIVRTKDRPKLLKRALQSIAGQTYRPIEVVLVNDGGCDLDIEELKTILAEVGLNYIRLEENTGRAHAGNTGIENARGEYIGFLDDDDEFSPEHVALLVTTLRRTADKAAYCDCEMVSRTYDFETMKFAETERHLFSSKDFSLSELLLENYIPLTTILFHRDLFSEVGTFDETLTAFEDWDILIRCGSRHSFTHINQVTAMYVQWSADLQIAQSREKWGFLDNEYDKVIQKHRDKFTPVIVRQLRDRLKQLTADRERQEREALLRDDEIARLRAFLRDKEEMIERTSNRCRDLENALSEREKHIRIIHSGRGWRLLSRYYKIRDHLFRLISVA
jgi:glycosyltransferase involved in cell wall biosynthesis